MKIDPFSLLYCLQLIRSENIGPIKFWQLVRQFGSPKAAVDFLDSHPPLGGREKNSLLTTEEATQEIERHQKLKIHLLSVYDKAFPQYLRTIEGCPPVLSVRGQLDLLNHPKSIAIVGARNASLTGKYFAKRLATDLSHESWIIVSGLARGIDGSAHLGSLKRGTIAVLAGGVDVIYPPEHRDLYAKIQDNGCIISEMPLSMNPFSSHFPRRNRLISGLSRGVIVVEAALKSGSLITANFSLDQGREVFAVPGSPGDPRCRGTNDLLRRGAHIVESIFDVTSVLGSYHTPPSSREEVFGGNYSEKPDKECKNDLKTTLEEQIFQDLSINPLAIEDLAAQYDCSTGMLLALLLELELKGLIVRYPNGTVSRTSV